MRIKAATNIGAKVNVEDTSVTRVGDLKLIKVEGVIPVADDRHVRNFGRRVLKGVTDVLIKGETEEVIYVLSSIESIVRLDLLHNSAAIANQLGDRGAAK